jgi:hypothetical protein
MSSLDTRKELQELQNSKIEKIDVAPAPKAPFSFKVFKPSEPSDAKPFPSNWKPQTFQAFQSKNVQSIISPSRSRLGENRKALGHISKCLDGLYTVQSSPVIHEAVDYLLDTQKALAHENLNLQ